MDKFEKQQRIFSIVAVLLLVSVLSLLVIIPWIFRDTSPGSTPKQAGIATSVAMFLRLLVLLGILYGIRLTKRKRHINREINIVPGIILLIFGLIILDGATAYIGQLLIASIGMFVCVFCDVTAVVVSFAALFYLKPKKKD